MKKILFLIPVILFSCKKEAAVTETVQNSDSAAVSEMTPAKPVDSAAIRDSIITHSEEGKKVLNHGVMRENSGEEIVREADASALPFSIGDEFKNDDQSLVIKIKNFTNPSISASVIPKNKEMNIRVNQIRLPNGDFDGPFGRDLTGYKVPQKGEVWLIIGKSNMASGNPKGSFTVNIE